MEDEEVDGPTFSQELDETMMVLREDLCEWLSKVLDFPSPLRPEEMMSKLDNGVMLCKLACLVHNKALESSPNELSYIFSNCNSRRSSIQTFCGEHQYSHPASLTGPLTWRDAKKIKRIRTQATSGNWFARDNISIFLDWCRERKIRDEVLFVTEGLVSHGEEKNVVLTLLELSRLAGRFGLPVPRVVSLEREIDSSWRNHSFSDDSSSIQSSSFTEKLEDMSSELSFDTHEDSGISGDHTNTSSVLDGGDKENVAEVKSENVTSGGGGMRVKDVSGDVAADNPQVINDLSLQSAGSETDLNKESAETTSDSDQIDKEEAVEENLNEEETKINSEEVISSEEKIISADEEVGFLADDQEEVQKEQEESVPDDHEEGVPDDQGGITAEDKEDIPSEDQEDIPAEIQEDILSEYQEDMPAEGQEVIPSEYQKDMPAEGQEVIPSEDQEDMPAEGQEDIPVEDQEDMPAEDISAENQEDMPAEGQEDILVEDQEDKPAEYQEDMPVEDQEDKPAEYQEDMPAEYQEDMPVEDQEDMPAEDQEDMPVEDQEDMPAEHQEDIPVEDQEDMPVEDQADMPVEDQDDMPVEGQEVIPSEDQGDIPIEDQEDMPAEDQKVISVDDQEDIPAEDLEDNPVKDQGDFPADVLENKLVEDQEDIPAEENQEDILTENQEDIAAKDKEEISLEDKKDISDELHEEILTENQEKIDVEHIELLKEDEIEEINGNSVEDNDSGIPDENHNRITDHSDQNQEQLGNAFGLEDEDCEADKEIENIFNQNEAKGELQANNQPPPETTTTSVKPSVAPKAAPPKRRQVKLNRALLELKPPTDWEKVEREMAEKAHVPTPDELEIDRKVSQYTCTCTCEPQFQAVKLRACTYKIGGRVCFLRLLRGYVMVRVGGGWSTLAEYLRRHDPCRVQKFPGTGPQGYNLVMQGRYKSKIRDLTY